MRLTLANVRRVFPRKSVSFYSIHWRSSKRLGLAISWQSNQIIDIAFVKHIIVSNFADAESVHEEATDLSNGLTHYKLFFDFPPVPESEMRSVWDRPMKKGPNGKYLCRGCRTEVPPGRRKTWCSDKCFNDNVFPEKAIFERDQGRCGLCKINLRNLERAYWEIRRDDNVKHRIAFYKAFPWLESSWTRHIYEIDHIVPVVEGGGNLGISNLRALCLPCHKSETKKLRARLAKRA